MKRQDYYNKLEIFNDRLLNIVEKFLDKIPNQSYSHSINLGNVITSDANSIISETPEKIEKKQEKINLIEEKNNLNQAEPETKTDEFKKIEFSDVKINTKSLYSTDFNMELHKRIMKTNVLICSTQLPGNGGSATNAYNIHYILSALKINSICFFFENIENSEEASINEFNHYKLKNIHILKKSLDVKNKFLEIINSFCGGPENIEIAYCKNYTSPIHIYNLFKDTAFAGTITYLVAGSRSFTNYLNKTPNEETFPFYKHMKDVKDDENKLSNWLIDGDEKASVETCDYINGNSKTCGDSFKLYSKNDSKYNGELYTTNVTYEILKSKIKPNSVLSKKNRKYDILFATSSLKRKVKNPSFAMKLFNDPRIQKYTKLVIGDYSQQYEDASKNILCEEKVTNIDAIHYMNNSKIVINTSYYEASPNTCLEAICSGAHVIISENSGGINEVLCKDDIIPLENTDKWIERIINVLETDEKCKNVENETNIIENLCLDVFQKKYKINKPISNDKNIISFHYKIMLIKDFEINLFKNNVLYIPEFRKQFDAKYEKQRIKFLNNIYKLKDFEVISQIPDQNIENVVSDCKMEEIPGAVRKFLKNSGFKGSIINYKDVDKKKELYHVFIKTPSLEIYNKILSDGYKFIDISSKHFIV